MKNIQHSKQLCNFLKLSWTTMSQNLTNSVAACQCLKSHGSEARRLSMRQTQPDNKSSPSGESAEDVQYLEYHIKKIIIEAFGGLYLHLMANMAASVSNTLIRWYLEKWIGEVWWMRYDIHQSCAICITRYDFGTPKICRRSSVV